MPRAPGSWKEVGMDKSPPRPPPTKAASLEMVVGRRTSMINSYHNRRLVRMNREAWKLKPGISDIEQEKFCRWVNEFMVTEPTKAEMFEGARQVRLKAGRNG